MSEGEFWIAIWRTVGAVAVAGAAVIGGCVGHEDYRISQAINNGADPIAAYCAFTVQSGESCHMFIAVHGR